MPAAPAKRARRRSIPLRDFLRAIPKMIRPLVPPELSGFAARSRWALSQCWYGNSDLHYEVWIRQRLGTLELGLHFEADPLSNARLLGAFRAKERRVRRALGDAVRIEEWDRGWARLWEPMDLVTLDDALLERVAARVARYIMALEPILRDELPADVAWRETT